MQTRSSIDNFSYAVFRGLTRWVFYAAYLGLAWSVFGWLMIPHVISVFFLEVTIWEGRVHMEWALGFFDSIMQWTVFILAGLAIYTILSSQENLGETVLRLLS